MSLIGGILGIDGIGAAAIEFSHQAGTILAKIIPDADKRQEVQLQLSQLNAQTTSDSVKASQAVMVGDSASDSTYTKNARPTVVYWSLAMVTAIAGMAWLDPPSADAMVTALGKVPPELFDMMKWGVGMFTVGRTAEKVAAPIAGAIAGALLRRKG